MIEFNSIFYTRNKLMHITFAVYVAIAILFVIVLIVGTINQYYYQGIACVVFTSLMALRAAYFIFEKINIDSNMKVVSYKLLRKKYDIFSVSSIKKIRIGQLRLVLNNSKQLPLSVDDENLFISCLQKLNPNITVE